MVPISLTEGQRFAKLLVLGLSPRTDQRLWRCACDCGEVTEVRAGNLLSGRTRSCGCLKADILRTYPPRLTHGMAGSPEHKIWKGMIRRCYNPNTKSYRDYGLRGITVCDRWRRDFAAFYADMGPRPSPRHSIERLDNGSGYRPDNCAWATKETQARNTRTVRLNAEAVKVIRFMLRRGMQPCILARLHGVNRSSIHLIRKGRTWKETADGRTS